MQTRRTNLFRWACAGATALAAVIGGCQNQQSSSSNERPKGTPAQWIDHRYENTGAPSQPVAETRPVRQNRSGRCFYEPNAGNGYNVSSMAFPTGDPATSAVMLHQVMPSEVTRNAEYTFEYHVTNLGNAPLQNVVVMMDSTSNINVRSSNPASQTGGGNTIWNLGELAPCETRVIEVTGVSSELGAAGNCISVSYNNVLCAATNVVQPALAIRKTATPNALLCDEIVYVIEVVNNGTGVARNVRVRDELPEGVVTADNGARVVDEVVGDLGPNETRRIEIRAKANRAGNFSNTAVATSEGGLRAESGAATTAVTSPTLSIASECRERQYLQRDFTHTYTITNTGNGACNDATARVSLPNGVEFVSASGGTLSGSTVVFDLDGLAPGASRQVSVTMKSNVAGTISTTATAECFCAEAVSANCSTVVTGIPAIVVEMVDEVDPVEVGTQTVYLITVRNQGTARDTNVRVTAILPPELEFVSATGVTAERVNGESISFAPVQVLEAGQEVSWRITVRAIGEGDIRTGLEVTSDKDSRPIRETESTNLYR